VCVCVCVYVDFYGTNICILCKTRPVMSINYLFSAVNFLYSKVFSILNVKDKQFCMVSLFERENSGFNITIFSAYLKDGLPGCVLSQFCIPRRYFHAGVPVCVFLPNQLLSYFSNASLTLIWTSCQYVRCQLRSSHTVPFNFLFQE
jgi:hypothetical protein